MPGIWEAMRDGANPCSVLTKSPLLLRDIELMKRARRADRVRRQPLGPDARREGLAGDRAAHAPPAQAPRGGRRAEPRRDPNRGPHRSADPGRQRLPSRSRRSSSSLRRGGRREHRRRSPSSARRGARDLVRLAAPVPPRPDPALRGALRARRLHAAAKQPPELAWRGWARSAGSAGIGGQAKRDDPSRRRTRYRGRPEQPRHRLF